MHIIAYIIKTHVEFFFTFKCIFEVFNKNCYLITLSLNYILLKRKLACLQKLNTQKFHPPGLGLESRYRISVSND